MSKTSSIDIEELLENIRSTNLLEDGWDDGLAVSPTANKSVSEDTQYVDDISTEPNAEDGLTAFTNNIEFDTKFRGYDKLQVDDYIDKISIDYNAICAKCAQLEQENEAFRKAIIRLESGAVK